MPQTAIDTHFHVFPQLAKAASGARYLPAYAATIDGWRQHARPAGVSHGVIVQTSFLGTDNTALLDAIATDPDRLRGVAVVAPDIGDLELDRLHAGGIRGVRLNRYGQPPLAEADAAAWNALTARLASRGWHVEMWADRGALAPLLDRLEPACDVVVAHYGAPHSDAPSDPLWAALRALPHGCHVKLSAPYRLGELDLVRLLSQWRDCVGADGLLWGSDWPWTNHEAGQSYASLRQGVVAALGGEALQDKVFRENPMKRYGFCG